MTAQAGWTALLIAVSLPNLSASLGGGSTTVLMPLLRGDLGLSTVQVGWIGGVRFLSLIALSLPIAAVVTRLGLRRAMVLAQIGFGLGLAALSVATTPALALIAVASAGVFLAAINPATTTAVIARFPASLRSQAMNIKQVGVPLGHLLAALLAPPLAAVAGWRVALLLIAIASIAGAVGTRLLYADVAAGAGIDADGAGIDAGGAGVAGSGTAGTHVAVLGTPTLHQMPAASMVLALLRHRPLIVLSVMQALTMGAQATLLAYFAVFFVDRGATLAVVAAYLAVMQVTGVVGRVAWGPIARYGFHDRPRPALAAVVATSALGVAALALLPAQAGIAAVAVVAILLGLGVMANAGMIEWVRGELLPPAAAPAATGLGYAIGAVGATIAPPLLGVVADRFGFPAAWAASAATLVVAVGLALSLPETAAPRT